MTEVIRDNNRVRGVLGALNTNGTTPTPIKALNNAIKIVTGAGGSDHGNNHVRDGNRVPVLMAVSSSDGVTPVEVYVDLNGSLLAKDA